MNLPLTGKTIMFRLLIHKEQVLQKNYGKLIANYSDTTTDVGYVWYRNINGAAEEQQIPTQYSSTTGTNLGKRY